MAIDDDDLIAERSLAVQQSPEFRALRRSFISFIAPLTALFLIWYLAYVLIAGFAPGFFAQSVGGSSINVGFLFGLGQFVTTFAITMVYRSWADKKYDPQAAALREHMEAETEEAVEADAALDQPTTAGPSAPTPPTVRPNNDEEGRA
ncbi:DUF485 domain-containing protein [Naumannella halotolerans]|uniref:Uncharacterized membrane protein (DUF485 family) n=1 Tax=Naumannella halotolerans TaxID=993414 RepID=A0A4R7J3T7_9ACTN|nr:DUF485 domain-containing protein [Naumannella halotolerans]TDT31067.1 uncharacterized membrane protein (DUF485 family) [Naumannella halotolerans]